MARRAEIILPRLDPDMEYGVVMKWLKKQGEKIKRGEPLFTLETEKITVDIESPCSGRLVEVLVPRKTKVSVGTVIAIIEVEEE